MKISDVKCFPCFSASRTYLFVKVETDEGLYGVGEFGITWKEHAGIGVIEHLKSNLIGQAPELHAARATPDRRVELLLRAGRRIRRLVQWRWGDLSH